MQGYIMILDFARKIHIISGAIKIIYLEVLK